MRRYSALLTLVLASSSLATAESLRPRRVLPKQAVAAADVRTNSNEIVDCRLVVKFADALRVRAQADGSVLALGTHEVPSISALASTLGARFSPLLDTPEGKLSALEQRAAQRSRVAQPDLAGMMFVNLGTEDLSVLVAAGEALQSLSEVEFAYIQASGGSPPNDIPPTTSDYTSNQTWRNSNPGIDVDYAWAQGLRGAGFRISDIEKAWRTGHEDLVRIGITPEPGVPIPVGNTALYQNHGCAVLGMISAMESPTGVAEYGCQGAAPAALVFTYPQDTTPGVTDRLATALTNAIADSAAGDVVLLEAVTPSGAPVETANAIWVLVKAGTDAGVVVVAAAGNGNEDLDSGTYSAYMGWGDSGAIIVGAGSADTNHDKLSFSTFGSRVNLQGWGQHVFTTCFGYNATTNPTGITVGGDVNQTYTFEFNGTSSATPMIAAACLLLQERAVQNCGLPFSSVELRDLLILTGTGQGSGGHIGPIPDLSIALQVFPSFTSFCWGDGSGTACPCGNAGLACHGCENSFTTGGGRLGATGYPSVTNDTLVLRGDSMPPTASCLYFQGTSQVGGGAGSVLDDGLLCVSGTIIRLGTKINVNGSSAFGGPVGDTPISIQGSIPSPGGTYYYQTDYRNSATFCTSASDNLSNGLSVVWVP